VKPAISLEAITRHHTGRDGSIVRALNDVDLTVPSGEFVAIVGPSGAGKSSLLNILGCLDRPTSGELRINDRLVSTMPSAAVADIRNAEIGFVFQSFNLIPALTARGNVELPMVYAGVGRRERRTRADEALARVGLAAHVDRHPNQLSGGQQQRVAVARAIVNDPAFILADEPTGNLDSESTEDVLSIIAQLHRTGSTVVLITHEDEVAQRAERTVTMQDGRIASDVRRRRSPADQVVPR
jgi:putative ABC transport system ATP-binding protein